MHHMDTTLLLIACLLLMYVNAISAYFVILLVLYNNPFGRQTYLNAR
jgi:hypothetical protein